MKSEGGLDKNNKNTNPESKNTNPDPTTNIKLTNMEFIAGSEELDKTRFQEALLE